MSTDNGSLLACPQCHTVFDAAELFNLQQLEHPDGCPQCGADVSDDEWEQD